MTLQNLPKSKFLVCKDDIWQPWGQRFQDAFSVVTAEIKVAGPIVFRSKRDKRVDEIKDSQMASTQFDILNTAAGTITLDTKRKQRHCLLLCTTCVKYESGLIKMR
jgi:hypothetical protein